MFNAVTVPRNPLLVWVPSEAIYVEVKGTPGGGKVGETRRRRASTGLCPSSYLCGWLGLKHAGTTPGARAACAPQLFSRRGQWARCIHQVPSVISWGLLVRATASGRKCLRQTCRCWKWGQCALKWKAGRVGALSVVCTLPTSSVLPPLSLIDNDIFSILREVLKGWKITFRTSPLLSFQPYCLSLCLPMCKFCSIGWSLRSL